MAVWRNQFFFLLKSSKSYGETCSVKSYILFSSYLTLVSILYRSNSIIVKTLNCNSVFFPIDIKIPAFVIHWHHNIERKYHILYYKNINITKNIHTNQQKRIKQLPAMILSTTANVTSGDNLTKNTYSTQAADVTLVDQRRKMR